ncbi:MAG: metallopeptidase family protein [Planctomycetota bacterium]|jgi:predicted Zn-dependent protease with MMP-like domain
MTHHEPVSDEERDFFDQVLEEVLDALPLSIHNLFHEIPLIIDDQPDPAVLEEMGIDDPGELCGLHTGTPLTERSIEGESHPPDTVHIFRDGILNQALDAEGYVDPNHLKEQIRITILHEYGHHFGLDEDDLAAHGYD